MAKIRFVIAAGVICGLTACHRADTSHANNNVSSRVPLQVKIEPAIKDGDEFIGVHNWCDDPTDAFTAHATENGKMVGSIQYCAAYGMGSAEGFTDKTRHHYVLIKRNTVHASSLIMYDLDIYRVADGNDFKVLSMPIEQTAEAACLTQKYVTSIVDSPAGGMELHLQRKIEKRDSDCDDLPPKSVMFPDAEQVIRFDVK